MTSRKGIVGAEPVESSRSWVLSYSCLIWSNPHSPNQAKIVPMGRARLWTFFSLCFRFPSPLVLAAWWIVWMMDGMDRWIFPKISRSLIFFHLIDNDSLYRVEFWFGLFFVGAFLFFLLFRLFPPFLLLSIKSISVSISHSRQPPLHCGFGPRR